MERGVGGAGRDQVRDVARCPCCSDSSDAIGYRSLKRSREIRGEDGNQIRAPSSRTPAHGRTSTPQMRTGLGIALTMSVVMDFCSRVRRKRLIQKSTSG